MWCKNQGDPILILLQTKRKHDCCLAGRRGRGYFTDRSYRRPRGSRGPRRPYYSYGDKQRGSRQQSGGLLVFGFDFHFSSILSSDSVKRKNVKKKTTGMAARVPLAALTVNNSNINPNPNSAWEAGGFFASAI